MTAEELRPECRRRSSSSCSAVPTSPSATSTCCARCSPSSSSSSPTVPVRGGPTRRRQCEAVRELIEDDRLAVQGREQVRRPQPRASRPASSSVSTGCSPRWTAPSCSRTTASRTRRSSASPTSCSTGTPTRSGSGRSRGDTAPGAGGDVRRLQLRLHHLGQRVGLGDLGRPLADAPGGVRPRPRRRRGPGRRRLPRTADAVRTHGRRAPPGRAGHRRRAAPLHRSSRTRPTATTTAGTTTGGSRSWPARACRSCRASTWSRTTATARGRPTPARRRSPEPAVAIDFPLVHPAAVELNREIEASSSWSCCARRQAVAAGPAADQAAVDAGRRCVGSSTSRSCGGSLRRLVAQ